MSATEAMVGFKIEIPSLPVGVAVRRGNESEVLPEWDIDVVASAGLDALNSVRKEILRFPLHG